MKAWFKKQIAAIKVWFSKKQPDVAPVDPPVAPPVVPPAPPPVTPPADGSAWHYCLFTDPTLYDNSNGAASQMGYFGVHGKINENLRRIAFLKEVQKLGGNVNCYIRGCWGGADALAYFLCGRVHPETPGKYADIRLPTDNPNGGGECDWAMWSARDLGIGKHLCWVLNDDASMPITRDTFAKAVASYTGSRLGAANIG